MSTLNSSHSTRRVTDAQHKARTHNVPLALSSAKQASQRHWLRSARRSTARGLFTTRTFTKLTGSRYAAAAAVLLAAMSLRVYLPPHAAPRPLRTERTSPLLRRRMVSRSSTGDTPDRLDKEYHHRRYTMSVDNLPVAREQGGSK